MIEPKKNGCQEEFQLVLTLDGDISFMTAKIRFMLEILRGHLLQNESEDTPSV